MFPVEGKKREKKGQERGNVRALRLSRDKNRGFGSRLKSTVKCVIYRSNGLKKRIQNATWLEIGEVLHWGTR